MIEVRRLLPQKTAASLFIAKYYYSGLISCSLYLLSIISLLVNDEPLFSQMTWIWVCFSNEGGSRRVSALVEADIVEELREKGESC